MQLHPLLVGSTTDPVKHAAAKAFGNPPPSIVQQAAQPAYDLNYYRERIAALVEDLEHNAKQYRKVVSAFKASGVWKGQYKTWGRTCRDCLGISPQRAHVLISELTESFEQDNGETSTPLDNTDKAEVLETVNDLPDPLDEPNPLAELEAQMAKAQVHAGPAPEPEPCAAPIFLAVPAVPDVPRDLIGFPIPSALLPRWEQRQEVQDRITAASKLRCALEEIAGKGHGNPLYGAYDWQGMIRTIGQLQFHLGQCKPEVVCYECDGDFLKLKASKGGDGITRHCHNCNDRGFITQSQWDKYAESKLEIIHKRVNARLAKCKED